MPLQKIAPDLTVNTDNIQVVTKVGRTDQFQDEHVIIHFADNSYEVEPEYTVGEICAALNGKCYYRQKYADQAGFVDVCVLHGQNSQYTEEESGPYRYCLKRMPYINWNDFKLATPVLAYEEPPTGSPNYWRRLMGLGRRD